MVRTEGTRSCGDISTGRCYLVIGLLELLIPNFFIFEIRVVLFRPRTSAAAPCPPMRQPVFSSTLTIWLSSLKVPLRGGASVNPNRTTNRRNRRRVLSFSCKNDVYLPIGALQMPAHIQNTSLRIARISKNITDSPLEGAKLLD